MVTRRAQFLSNVEICKKYIKTHGELYFPRDDPLMRKLGNWWRRQNQRKNVPDDEREILDELRRHVDIRPREERNNESWQGFFNQLVQYKEEYHTLVISKKDREHKSLFEWAIRQRRLEKTGRLLPKRREALVGLGFRFGNPRDVPDHDDRFTKKQRDAWDKMYQELVDFKTTFGHCRVKFDDEARRPLAQWVRRQRVAYVSGQMDSKRLEKLNSIGFLWIVREIDHPHLPRTLSST